MESQKLTHEAINKFAAPTHHLDVLIAKTAGWHMVSAPSPEFSDCICNGAKLYKADNGFPWFGVPYFSFKENEMLKIVGDYIWRCTRQDGKYIVTMSKSLEGPTVTLAEEALAFALAKAWLHLQVTDVGVRKEVMTDNAEALKLTINDLIRRALKYEATPDKIDLFVKGRLSDGDMAALDDYAKKQNMLWAHTTIDNVSNTTTVRYLRPVGKDRVWGVTDLAG